MNAAQRRLGRLVPRSVGAAVPLLRTDLRVRSRRHTISDVKTWTIQPGVWIEAYWVSEGFGPGPGFSVYVLDDEVLRLDAFGRDEGHCHYNIRQNGPARCFFGAGTMLDHIERGMVELRRNVPYCLATNASARIRTVTLAEPALHRAAGEVEAWMRELVARRSGEAVAAV